MTRLRTVLLLALDFGTSVSGLLVWLLAMVVIAFQGRVVFVEPNQYVLLGEIVLIVAGLLTAVWRFHSLAEAKL